jgi:hypothetical protein
MKHFYQIIIQSKYDIEDFRAFCHCVDTDGIKWELRGYGNTAGEAAEDAWNCYKDDTNWDFHGYVVDNFE